MTDKFSNTTERAVLSTSGEVLAFRTSSAASLDPETGYSAGPNAHKRTHGVSQSPVVATGNRAKLLSLWSRAKTASSEMTLSAKTDRLDVFGAASKLSTALEDMWGLRENRDHNWVGILDQIQLLLSQLSDNGIENISVEQCICLARLIEQYLGGSTKTPDDLREVVRRIADLEMNPYAGLDGLANA